MYTHEQILKMRTIYAGGGVSQLELAINFEPPCDSVLVGLIVRGEMYQDAPGPITKKGRQNLTRKHKRNSRNHPTCCDPSPNIAIVDTWDETTCKSCLQHAPIGHQQEQRGTTNE